MALILSAFWQFDSNSLLVTFRYERFINHRYNALVESRAVGADVDTSCDLYLETLLNILPFLHAFKLE